MLRAVQLLWTSRGLIALGADSTETQALSVAFGLFSVSTPELLSTRRADAILVTREHHTAGGAPANRFVGLGIGRI